MQKNEVVTLLIHGVTSEGMGVGRCENGMAVFVPGTIAGEEVRAKILRVQKQFCFAKLDEVLSPSPERTESDCPISDRCGGCTFRHMSYRQELHVKQKRVQDAFARIAGLDIIPIDIIGSDNTICYRNKAQIPVAKMPDGRVVSGFYAKNSHRVIPQNQCRLHPPVFDQITQVVLAAAAKMGVEPYDEATGTGQLRHILIRRGAFTGQTMVCPVVTRPIKNPRLLTDALSAIPGVESIYENINDLVGNAVLTDRFNLLWGKPHIEEKLLGKTFCISPKSFFQINSPQAEKLYQKAAEYAALTQVDTLLDLYCGTGTIGLTMADQCGALIGVEIEPQAVENAGQNAARNQIANARFLCADASAAAQELEAQGIRPDVVLLDPPRKGCGEPLMRTVRALNPRRIVYISCDPATLARDVKTLFSLERNPYRLVEAAPFDLFPRTPHVETVVLIER